jgi:type II secretory pathway pseudopilin PulG
VVIGIIALLISILLPALNKARAAANFVACQSNLRQVGYAAIMHAQDHKGYFPMAGLLTRTFGMPDAINDSGRTHQVYFTYNFVPRALPSPAALALYLGVKLKLDTFADVTAALQEDNGLKHIFTCPSADPTFAPIINYDGTTPGSVLCWSSYDIPNPCAATKCRGMHRARLVGATGFKGNFIIKLSTTLMDFPSRSLAGIRCSGGPTRPTGRWGTAIKASLLPMRATPQCLILSGTTNA